ncbi:MAG: hypothetical protein LBC20_00885 [Planctomycetaceae bacterium]|jgi:hypothetical protein|nr:hypothetical protein [Planctomycetaceae bacterium]
MSETLEIGIIAEGPTDILVIKEIVENLISDQYEFICTSIQPKCSAAFEQLNTELGTGWSGVCRCLLEMKKQSNGKFDQHIGIQRLNMLIIHLDVDVTRQSYADGHLQNIDNNLPCPSISCPLPPKRKKLCPSNCDIPRQRADTIRQVVLNWLNNCTPQHLVFCTPSDAMDAWVFAAFFPDDICVQQNKLECVEKPERLLTSKSKQNRIKKTVADYRKKVVGSFGDLWSNARKNCSEAERFSQEFMQVLNIVKK